MQGRKRIVRALGGVLIVSMAVTEGLLLLQGRWREAIPLHLCSLSAIAAAALAFAPRQALLDFLWYLGMPGAALALLFPAPAISRWQALLDASYVITHAMILLVPGSLIAFGMRPGRQRGVPMLLVLLGIAAVACGVNQALGTNFLFLMAPPAGTPLEWAFSLGFAPYLILLFALMLLLCALMDRLAAKLGQKTRQ